jgi:hypothetical protein
MKNTLLLFGIAGITTALFSFTFIEKSDEAQNPKKERHIKMMKIENGKKMELDTVLTNDDVFVWNGDTILPEKHGQAHMTVDNKGRNENVMILRHQGGKPGEPMIWNMDSGEDMEIVTEDVDSLGKKIVVRRHINDGEGDHMFFLHDGDMKHFAPMPPVPPLPQMRMHHSGQIIDLNDPNVISYKKKDLKDGREKIEIIRKKSTEPDEMTFDFDADDQLMPPPPPPVPGAPEIIREYNDDNGKVKIIEKSTKVDGKDGKQIQVEVESKETK